MFIQEDYDNNDFIVFLDMIGQHFDIIWTYITSLRDIKKIRELEEILGVKKVNPFGTYNIEIFKERLSDMTNLDLQNLCEKIGVFASGSRMQIKEKLLREFKSVSRGTISMTNESPSIKLDPSNVLHKKTLKILGEI